MKIIDENGAAIETPDLTLGYLVGGTEPVEHPAVEGVEEVSHYETVTEYPGGGRDVRKVIDVPGVPAQAAWTEQVPIKKYVRYTAEELAAQEEALRSKKLEEVSNCCEKTICAGIDVTFTDGTQEHFSLETSDQTNIDSVFNSVVMGATEYPYHADGEPCKMYSAADIITLYMSEKSFITKQTTYNNALRQWIKRETDKDVLSGIEYGSQLPDDLSEKMNGILTAANEQIDNIVTKLTGGSDSAEDSASQSTDSSLPSENGGGDGPAMSASPAENSEVS